MLIVQYSTPRQYWSCILPPKPEYCTSTLSVIYGMRNLHKNTKGIAVDETFLTSTTSTSEIVYCHRFYRAIKPICPLNYSEGATSKRQRPPMHRNRTGRRWLLNLCTWARSMERKDLFSRVVHNMIHSYNIGWFTTWSIHTPSDDQKNIMMPSTWSTTSPSSSRTSRVLFTIVSCIPRLSLALIAKAWGGGRV